LTSLPDTSRPPTREPGARTARFLDLVAPIGNLVLAQLVFFCCSLTVVLIVPAAVALQRTTEAVLVDREYAVLRAFGRQLPGAIRRYLLIGLLIDLLAVMLAFSLLFWVSARGPAAVAGLIAVVVLSGLLVGGYLCALAESTVEHPTLGTWLRAAYRRLLRQPLPSAAGVVIMATWFLLLARLPTAALVGTGLVPALLAHWLLHPRRRPDRPAP
jgi:uncharacterized membrane protein YesL